MGIEFSSTFTHSNGDLATVSTDWLNAGTPVWRVLTNEAMYDKAGAGQTERYALTVTNMSSTDHYVQADCRLLSTTNCRVGVVIRGAVGTDGSGIEAVIDGANFVIKRRTNGVATNLSTIAHGLTAPFTVPIRLQANDNFFTAEIVGQGVILMAYSTVNSTNLKCGLLGSSANGQDVFADNFECGVLAPTPTIVANATTTLTASRSPALTFLGPPAEDDIVVMMPSSTTTSSITIPTGWTNALGGTTDVESTGNVHQACAVVHKVTAAEALAATVTFTATNLYDVAETGHTLGCVIRNVDPNNIIDLANSKSGGAATPHVLASLEGDNMATGSLVVGRVAKDGTGAYATRPAGWGFVVTSNVNMGGALLRKEVLTTAGTDIAEANITPSASDEYVSILIAFTAMPTGYFTGATQYTFTSAGLNGHTYVPTSGFNNHGIVYHHHHNALSDVWQTNSIAQPALQALINAGYAISSIQHSPTVCFGNLAEQLVMVSVEDDLVTHGVTGHIGRLAVSKGLYSLMSMVDAGQPCRAIYGVDVGWSLNDIYVNNIFGQRVPIQVAYDIASTVTNKALTSNVVTLTTSVAHGFTNGESVEVALSPADPVFDGTYTITSIPTSTTFTYAKTNADVTSVASDGTAVGANTYGEKTAGFDPDLLAANSWAGQFIRMAASPDDTLTDWDIHAKDVISTTINATPGVREASLRTTSGEHFSDISHMDATDIVNFFDRAFAADMFTGVTEEYFVYDGLEGYVYTPTSGANGHGIAYHHHHTDLNLDWRDTADDNVIHGALQALMDEGYVLASIELDTVHNWGTNTHQATMSYVADKIAERAPGLLGRIAVSKGAIGALLCTANFDATPAQDTRGVYLIDPGFDLQILYDTNPLGATASINTAYNIPGGGSYATQTTGHDPANLDVDSWNGIYLRVSASPDDTVALKVDHADALLAAATHTLAKSLYATTGQHYQNSTHADPDDIVDFFNRAMQGPLWYDATPRDFFKGDEVPGRIYLGEQRLM